ncbi:hypothetical protein IE81DRAFT_195963 [Ceraceosorus guamensis]|uniref:Uncharacterized protein n=1 Tax=Ceraceosorus guamensis TaxID=1522189 RepID=A0A316VTX4_9BASI|nr:hypothetical protein IE81DRAFT_195963 [Ceraceosorus guamensis]PWN41056.1 hypothetical protein IE81DRAFT_195963 [Ceraceosorus guamensis]
MAFGGSKGAPMGASVGAADNGGSFASGSLAANTQGELKSKRFRMHLNETDARETEQQDLRLREADTQQADQSAFSQSPQTQDAEPARRRRSRPPDSSFQCAVESLQDAVVVSSDSQDWGASNDAQRRKRPTNDVERARVGASSEARGTSASDAQSFFIREKGGKAGIAPGQKPDRDEVFLQALSTGSRTKFDKFDQEFNKLRIARPQYAGGSLATTHFVNQEEADDQMFEAFKLARAEELDDLFSVSHGNFVAVDFVPLIKRREQRPASTTIDGRPNFKKFKQVRGCASFWPM